jgi:hypothetical protein
VSGNRNTGAFTVSTPVVAFLDDDACAQPGWLAGLLAPLDDPSVCGTGGAIRLVWHTGKPAWVPEEFGWAWVGSYTGQPTTVAPVRNVWSASMAVRREVFLSVGGFRVGFGKVGDRSRPEDTDVCLRMSQASAGRWMYVPEALIEHPVPADRTTVSYFLTRCYHEGRGKVELSRLHARQDSLDAERAYLRQVLPRGVIRGLANTVRGHGWTHAVRAGAIAVGVGAAAWGGAVETLRGRAGERALW